MTQERKRKKKDIGTLDQAVGEYDKGLKRFHKGKIGEAAAVFRGILDSFPQETGVCDRARTYLVAIERAEMPKKPRAKTSDDHYLQGIVEFNGGESAKALGHFKKGLAMAPKDDRFHLAMAAAMLASGREEEALEALAEAGRRNQENLVLATRDRDFAPLWEQESRSRRPGRRQTGQLAELAEWFANAPGVHRSERAM